MTALLSLLFVTATAAGLGIWFPLRSPGGRMFLGAAAIPVLLYLLNFGSGIGISTASLVVAVASLPGLVRAVLNARNGGMTARIFFHPTVVLIAVAGALMAVRGIDGYSPYSGDEFASWLHWTKEAFVTDTMLADGMAWQNYAYTQGWPLAMLYPQLLSDQFDLVRSMPVGLVWHAALLGLVYDAFLSHLKRNGLIESTARREAVAWLVILLLLSAEATWTLLPQLLLVEKPQVFMIAAMFGFLFLGLAGGEDRNWCALGAGCALAAGYLVKVIVLGAAPAALLVALTPAYRGTAHWRPRTGDEWRSLFRTIACVLVPLAAIYVSWPLLRPVAPPGGCLADPFAVRIGGSIDPLGHAANVAMALAKGIGNYLAVYKLPITVLAVAGLLGGLTHRRFVPVIAGILLYDAVYVGGLHSLYAFCYGEYQLSQLASLQRYIRIPLRLTHLFGLVMLAFLVIEFAGRRRIGAIRKSLHARWITALLVLAIVSGGVWQVRALDLSLRNTALRDLEPRRTVLRIARVEKDIGALLKLIDKQGLKMPLIVQIAQNRAGFDLRIARYGALARHRGHERRFYRMHNDYSWGREKKNLWMKPTTVDRLIAQLKKADIVWPLFVDPWILTVISKLTDNESCRRVPTEYFLVRTPEGPAPFHCVAKEGR